MTKRRWLTVAGLLACLVCVPLVVLAILPDDRPGVTEANFARIQNGMTLKDVEDIFGEPGQLFLFPSFSELHISHPDKEEGRFRWGSESGGRAFVFFTEGQVTNKDWIPSTETVLQKIRRWLRF